MSDKLQFVVAPRQAKACRTSKKQSESLRRNQNWERSDQPYTQGLKHLKKSALSKEVAARWVFWLVAALPVL